MRQLIKKLDQGGDDLMPIDDHIRSNENNTDQHSMDAQSDTHHNEMYDDPWCI